jgi:hypothetical protein
MNKTEKNWTRILSVYTGRDYKSIPDVLKDQTALDMLWLEILVNDNVPWEKYLHIPEIRKNYEKASIWYANFKTLMGICGIQRKALKPSKGVFDMREYRKFIEVLRNVS